VKKAARPGKKKQPGLRQRAEERVRKGAADVSKMPLKDVKALVHELEVHQVELEIQNEELRQAQIDLAEARDLYLDLYESAPAGYLTLDGRRTIRRANLTAASLLGVDRAGLIGARLSKYAVSEHRDAVYLAIREAVTSGDRQSCEVDFLRPDGSRFVGLLEISPAEGGEAGEAECRVVMADISDRKGAERERDETLALLEAIFDSAPIGLGFWDKDLRFVRLNRTLAEINGYPEEYHLGKRVDEVLPDLGPAFLESWEEVLRSGEPWHNVEVEGRTPACPGETRHWIDSYYPVRVGDEFLGVAATILDVTELKREQEELRSLNESLDLLYRSAPVGLCELDREIRFVRVNDRLAELNGVPADMHIGRTVRQVVPDVADFAERTSEEIFRTGEPVLDREFTGETLAHPGLQRTWIEDWWPLKDERNEVTGISVVVKEITEGKRAQEELRTLNEELEQRVEQRTRQTLEGQRRIRQMSRVFQDAVVPILMQDDEGRVVEMNAEAERVLEWSRGELIGKSVKTVLLSEMYGEFDRIVEEGANGVVSKNKEVVLLAKSGRKIPALLTLSVLSGESEEGVARTAVIVKDISELKRAEEALRASERSLREEKERLKEKNIALREILEQVEEEKERIRQGVKKHLVDAVLPALDRLAESGEKPSLVAMRVRNALQGLSSPLGGSVFEGTARLTAREQEICQMLRGGLSSKEISQILNCSHQTVEKHRKNIRKKLGIVGKRAHLGAYLNER